MDRLFAQVYPELRALAGSYFRRESQTHTLQPTALVNEAYLKLVDQNEMHWKNRTHFFAMAATAMRRILIDHARTRQREKRGGNASRVPLNEGLLSVQRDEDVLAVDEALDELARLDPRHAQLVEYRFFGGLTEEQCATVLGISERTIRREWRVCRAWLRDRLSAGWAA